jgi:hypothetical protein
LHAAATVAAETASRIGNALVAEKSFGELTIEQADVASSLHRRGAAKQLGLETLAASAVAQEIIDQKLHQMNAVTLRRARLRSIVGSGQEEVVHAADLRLGIAQARGDARAENRREHDPRVVGYAIFPLHDMYPSFETIVRSHPKRLTAFEAEDRTSCPSRASGNCVSTAPNSNATRGIP